MGLLYMYLFHLFDQMETSSLRGWHISPILSAITRQLYKSGYYRRLDSGAGHGGPQPRPQCILVPTALNVSTHSTWAASSRYIRKV